MLGMTRNENWFGENKKKINILIIDNEWMYVKIYNNNNNTSYSKIRIRQKG